MIVLLHVSLTSSPTQSRPEISVEALASQRTTEISRNASFSDQLLSRALEIGDALSALYRLIATSPSDGDPMVVTTLPDESREATNLTDGVFEGAEATSFLFYVLCYVAGMTPVVDVFPWEVMASSRIFSSFGEKRSEYLGVVFGEETVYENVLFGFVWEGRVIVSRLFFSFWGRVRNPCASSSYLVETHFSLVPSCDL